jgi:hypothetical protein
MEVTQICEARAELSQIPKRVVASSNNGNCRYHVFHTNSIYINCGNDIVAYEIVVYIIFFKYVTVVKVTILLVALKFSI